MTKLLKIYANEWNKTQKKSLRKLSLQTDVPLSTCQKIVRKKTRWHPIRVGVWIAASRRSLIAFIVKIKEPVINEVT
jgi:hypothetical protein